jgi:hypothetical protein
MRLAVTGTGIAMRSPLVLAKMEWVWMVVRKGVRWCSRQAATSRKCQAEHPVLADMETSMIAT